MYACILKSKPCILEPMQKAWIDVPQEYMGSVTRELQRRRGIVGDMTQKDELMSIEARMPVAESFGFAGDIRGASEGHALWSTENSGFDKLPSELQTKVVSQIRDRKGLKKELPKAEEFLE
jgi:elongation factor 2